jgi:regulator of sigma E protease
MFSLIIFIIILSILIVVHEFGHFITARRIGVRVEAFSIGFGWQLLKKKKNHTEYSISAVPLGGYVKLAGDNLEEYKGKSYEFFSQPPGKRFQIIFSGPLLNYILGFLCFWLIFFVGYPTLTTKVGGLVDGFGAQEAGLKVGDMIKAVDAGRVEFWEDLQKIIQKKQSQDKVILTIIRGKQEFQTPVFIKTKQVEDPLGGKRSVGLLGITPFDEIVIVKHGFVASFFLGINKTWEITSVTLRGLWRMVTGRLSIRESVTGPLGIFYITSKAASLGIIAVLHLLALLSVSLAIFNLLPLPVLDGGHIVFLGLEKIRGKTLSIKAERIVMQIGVTVLAILVLFVTYNDIMRFFGDKLTSIIGR